MSARLAGKVVVVVGGTSGLGLSAVRACVREQARVVAVGRDANKAAAVVHEFGDAVRTWVGDATQPETAQTAIQRALSDFGAFHGLYHVAGGSGRRRGDGPLHEISDEGWNYTLQLNLTSLFYSNRAAVRQFLSQGGAGSVVNCGSVLGFSPSPRFFATQAYAAAKAAIEGMTRSSAAYYAAQNIRFNGVAPGLVVTPMSDRAQKDPAIQDFIRTKQPLDGGRMGQPQDLDSLVVWLLSDESRFVTGQMISVDGGWSVSEGR